MQKIVNGLAIFSGLVSLTVVGAGGWIYLEKDNIVDGIKTQMINSVTDVITGSLPGLVDSSIPELPGTTGGALVPEVGSGIPSGSFGGASGSSAGLPF